MSRTAITLITLAVALATSALGASPEAEPDLTKSARACLKSLDPDDKIQECSKVIEQGATKTPYAGWVSAIATQAALSGTPHLRGCIRPAVTVIWRSKTCSKHGQTTTSRWPSMKSMLIHFFKAMLPVTHSSVAAELTQARAFTTARSPTMIRHSARSRTPSDTRFAVISLS
jgi:hypothetical protein